MSSSEYARRARAALAAANARDLTVMQATRDRFARLAAQNAHDEKDKQAIRALERRVNGPRRAAPRNTRPAPRGRGLNALPPFLFREHIAPHLNYQNLGAAQLTSKNMRAAVGNALRNERFSNRELLPLIRRFKELMQWSPKRRTKAEFAKALKKFVELGWTVRYAGGGEPWMATYREVTSWDAWRVSAQVRVGGNPVSMEYAPFHGDVDLSRGPWAARRLGDMLWATHGTAPSTRPWNDAIRRAGQQLGVRVVAHGAAAAAAANFPQLFQQQQQQ